MNIRPGDRVRIRTEDKSVKLWGTVVDTQMDTKRVEVTIGPEAAKLGLRPDVARRFIPGRTSVRITVEIEL